MFPENIRTLQAQVDRERESSHVGRPNSGILQELGMEWRHGGWQSDIGQVAPNAKAFGEFCRFATSRIGTMPADGLNLMLLRQSEIMEFRFYTSVARAEETSCKEGEVTHDTQAMAVMARAQGAIMDQWAAFVVNDMESRGTHVFVEQEVEE
ncbi:MAG: hypothetical protein ACYTEQ_12310 [Planctomycetota bacterium]|jgi:hypothetical protein